MPTQPRRPGRAVPRAPVRPTLALIRHTAVCLPPGLCYGRLDPELAGTAPAEIDAVLARLAGLRPRSIRTSPARRCQRLARAIASALGGEVVPDDRLLELDFGAWEGLAWDQVPRAALDRWAADLTGFTPPGGESGAALVARVTAAHQALPDRGTHVVVSHGGPLRVLRALLRGEPVDLGRPASALGSVELFPRAEPATPT